MSSRRRFLTLAGGALATGAVLAARPWSRWGLGGDAGPSAMPLGDGAARAGDALAELLKTAPRARFWASVDDAGALCESCHTAEEGVTKLGKGAQTHAPKLIRCQLCAQRCAIADGERGRCRARYNKGGVLYSLVYGRPWAVHLDPIEKKPFYHFLPGIEAFSLGTAGCPLSCKFCQNWQLSQARPEDQLADYRPPASIVSEALARKSAAVAFTYNETTVFTEYMLDVARLARERKLRPVLISCGLMNESPLAEMCQALDAIKIDLKGYSDDFYRNVSGARLQPVLRSIKQIRKAGVHLELVNLVVPTLNDAEPMLHELARFVVGELGPDVPLHFTRFHPDYQLRHLPPTPVSTLERARAIAMEHGVRYAFVGNVPGHPGNHTYCYKCGKVVIEREGFFVNQISLDQGKCRFCKTPIAGVWA